MMKKNFKSALMAAVFLSALYCPAKAEFVPSGQTYDTYGYQNSGTLTVSGTIENNTTNNISNPAAYSFGGAIYNTGILNVSDSTVFQHNFLNGSTAGNEYYSGSAGGAIANYGPTLSIGNNVHFIQNGFKNQGVISSAITNLTQLRNSAGAIGGGAIFNNAQGANITIGTNAIFRQNVAAGYGGAIYNIDGNVQIGDGATFDGNTAIYGGAITNDQTNATAILNVGKGAFFTNNKAIYENGGAIANSSGQVTIDEGATFSGNSADYAGGAVFNQTDSTFVIEKGATFSGNISNAAKDPDWVDGGGAISNRGTLTVKGGTGSNGHETSFSGNSSSYMGGAIFNKGQITLDTTDGNITFSNNTATLGSDMYLAQGSQVTISGNNNVTLSSSGSAVAGSGSIVKNGSGALNIETGNFAKDYTGQYTQNAGKLNVTNATMFKNANILGGTIDLNEGAKLNGSTINLADGTAINIKSGVIEFTNGTNIIASSANALINNNDGATLKLSGVDFSGFQGKLSQSNGTLELNNATANASVSGGALSLLQGSSLTADNLTLTGDANIKNSNLHVTSGLAQFKNYYVNKSDISTLSFTNPTTNSTGTYDAGFQADEINITNHNMQVTGTTVVNNDAVLNNSVLHSTDKFSVGQNLNSTGSEVTVDANGLAVTGTSSITDSKITSTGNASFGGNSTVSGSQIHSNGNTEFKGTLTASQGSTISTTGGNITATGAASLDNTTVNANGSASFDGGLTATNGSSVQASNGLTVGKSGTGDLDATGSTITVTGGGVNVAGNTDLTNTIANVTGNGTFGNGLNVNGGSNLGITGSATVTSGGLSMNNGQMTVGNGLTVTGNSLIENSSKLTVTGNALFNNDLKVDGSELVTSSGSDLTVVGHTIFENATTNFGGEIDFQGGLETIGSSNLTFNTDLIADALDFATGTQVTVNGGKAVISGQSDLDKTNLTINNKDDAAEKNNTFGGNMNLKNQSNLVITNGGNASITGNTEISDNSKLDVAGDVDITGSLTSTGNANTVKTGGGLTVGTGVNLANTTLTVGKDMTVTTGDTVLTDTIANITGTGTFGGNLSLTGTAANKSSMTVTGNLTADDLSLTTSVLDGKGNVEVKNVTSTGSNISSTGLLTADGTFDMTGGKLTVGNDFTVNSTAELENVIANVTGNALLKDTLTVTGGSLTANEITVQGASATLTDTSLISKGDISVKDLVVNEGTKQTTVSAANDLTASSVDADNAKFVVGNDMSVTGNTVLNNSVAQITGNGTFNSLQINKDAAESTAKNQFKVDGTLSAAVLDATNASISAGNGLSVTGASDMKYSSMDVTGDAQFNSTLTTANSSIVTKAIDGGANGDLSVTGLATLDNTSATVAGAASFNSGLVANKDAAAVEQKYSIKTGGDITSTTMDVTNVAIDTKNLTVSDVAELTHSTLKTEGDAQFAKTLDTNNSTIAVGGDGNLTVTDKASLVDTKVGVGGNAEFANGLETSSTDNQRREFIVGKDFTSTTTVLNGTNLAVRGNLISSDAAQFTNSNVTVTGNATFGNGLSAIGNTIDNKSHVVVNGDSDVTGDLSLTKGSYSVLGNSSVSGLTTADDYSEIHVLGDGTFTDKLTVQNNSSIEIGNNITFNNGFDLLNNSVANIHGDPTLDGDIRVTNGSVMNFVNPTRGFTTATGGSLFMDNGTINEMNYVITNNSFNGDFVIADNSTANFTVDIDPRNFKADSFTFNSINSESGADATVMISDFNFSTYPLDRHIQLPQMFYSNTEIADNINFIANDKLVFSPIGWYGLFGSQGTGYTASLVKYNPQVFRGQVATRAQFANQWVIDDMLLNHGMLQANRYLNPDANANKYSAILPQFAPYQYNKREGGLWFKTYGNFETLSMTQDLNVKNNAYGALFGADFPVYELKNGWSFMPTTYVAYNGAHQTFDYVGMYQNGGQAGFMGTFMKGKFIGSVLANGGIYSNSMDVAGYTDETFNWYAGAAGKAAYNFDVTEHFRIQPTLMAMYNTFGEQNWYSEFGDMGMYSGYLYGLNVAPGLNLIYGKKDWSVYATFQYVFNPLDANRGHVGRTVDLPRIGLRHTFFEYGLGFTKMWKERLNSYGQITFRNGGRTGISFQFGLIWLFGSGK